MKNYNIKVRRSLCYEDMLYNKYVQLVYKGGTYERSV